MGKKGKIKMPFSKVDHSVVIWSIAKGLKGSGGLKNYLELGIKKGSNFNKIAPFAEKAYAVDIQESSYRRIKDNKNLIWYCGTSQSFLSSYEGEPFDLIFIDADHSHKSSLEDFKLASKVLREGGIILLHDVYPPGDEFISREYCGDTYKTALWIKENVLDEFEYVTLPFYYGVGVARKVGRYFTWSTDDK